MKKTKLVPTEDFDDFSEDESPASPTTCYSAITRSNDPPSIPPQKKKEKLKKKQISVEARNDTGFDQLLK